MTQNPAKTKAAYLGEPFNEPFNEYRIRFIGKRLKELRTHKKRLETMIAGFEKEISERTAARKEHTNAGNR